MEPLVSIIIPTYNRAQLLKETLDSILNQTYKEWECLIIDDRSTDGSQERIKSHVNGNSRFQYLKRPESKPKGANACRNIGLENANGDYVIFFDSDDLMQPDHIEVKINAILLHKCDYVIAKTNYFNSPENNAALEQHYNFESKDISAYNYIAHNINWLTYDVCIKSDLAKSISFNEALSSGQEFNYFSKLTLHSVNAIFIKKVLTLRRYHDDSIQGKLRSNRINHYVGFFKTYWHTYIETKLQTTRAMRIVLVHRCASLAKKIPNSAIPYKNELFRSLKEEMGLKGFYHILRISLSRQNR